MVTGVSAVLCGLASVGSILLFQRQGGAPRLVATCVFTAPVFLAWAVLRRQLVVRSEGLAVQGLLRRKLIAWAKVLAVEQTRRSFVIITTEGDVSAGWIDGAQRDLLFRKVLELAKLSLEPKEPRWGIVARFTRSQTPERISAEQILRSRRGKQDLP